MSIFVLCVFLKPFSVLADVIGFIIIGFFLGGGVGGLGMGR